MSPVLVELGLAAIGLWPIAGVYRLRESAATRGRLGWVPWGGALAQLLAGLLLLGVAPGIAVVGGGWMALGGPFVAALNADRTRTLAAARWVGAAGGACLVAGLVARTF